MKTITISVIIAVALIVGSLVLAKSNNEPSSVVGVNNVTVVNGTQIIEITARGGYQPRRSVAKVGIPTILRFSTNGTFDCSSSVRIPSLNISKLLPQKGLTDIDIGSGQVGTLKGSCGMGMYPFDVEFTF